MPKPTHKPKSSTAANNLGFDVPGTVESQSEPATEVQSPPSDSSDAVAEQTQPSEIAAPATQVASLSESEVEDLPKTFEAVIAERTRLNNLPHRITPAESARLKRLDDLFMKMQNGFDDNSASHEFAVRSHPTLGNEFAAKVHLRLKERLHDIARRHPKLAAEVQGELAKLDGATA